MRQSLFTITHRDRNVLWAWCVSVGDVGSSGRGGGFGGGRYERVGWRGGGGEARDGAERRDAEARFEAAQALCAVRARPSWGRVGRVGAGVGAGVGVGLKLF